MTCLTNVTQIQSTPMKVYWGKQHAYCVHTVASVASSLGGKYFTVVNHLGIKYAYWFDVNNASTAPVVAGATLLECNIPVGASAEVVALSIKTANDLLVSPPFYVAVNADEVEIKALLPQSISTAAIVDGATGFTLSTSVLGIGGDLGCTKDDIELKMDTTMKDVTCHQTGETPISSFVSKLAVTVSLTLLEFTKEKEQLLLASALGNSFTPSGVGATKIIGMGSSAIGRTVEEIAGMLIFHPVNLADAVKAQDKVIWKTTPMVKGIKHSSVNPDEATLEFTAYIDKSINSAIDIIAFGDWTQNVQA